MIEVKHLNKQYGNFYAIKDINLNINEGDYIAITGRSGSGKSTLFNIIGGLDSPSSGEVKYRNENVDKFDDQKISKYRNTVIGFIFQSYNLELSYTVYQNIEIPLLISGISKKNRHNRILEVAKKLNIESKLYTPSNKLSGGEKQRVAIARALINNPKIILADEPCGNLDSTNSKAILDIFKGLNDDGITILLVTHQITDAKDAKRIITLADGEILNEHIATF